MIPRLPRLLRLTPCAALVAAAFLPAAHAQTNEELLRELRALKERIGVLEQKLGATASPASQASPAPAATAATAAGMTPEEKQDFNRIAVKAEALEDSRDALGLKNLKIGGFMDPTFISNRRQDRAGFQFLNRVDDDGYNYDNSYFGAAVLDFQKETDSGTRWRLSLAPNRGVGSVVDGASIVQEASISKPLTDLQTRLIAGQIPDWSGYEYLQPTLNKLITHNLLFDFTLPAAYTGVGLDITRGKWIYKAMLANMNATRKQSGDHAPVIAYRVDYARGEFQGFGFAGVHGKAPNFTSNVLDPVTGDVVRQADSRLDLFEFDAYFIRGDWTVQGQVSLGRQRQAAITVDPVSGELRDASWWGLSGLVAHKFSPRFETIARLDYLNNRRNGGGLLGYTAADSRNGIGPDPAGNPEIGANRYALSLGASYLLDLNTTLKVEYRLDRANLPVFLDVKSGSWRRGNRLLGVGMVASF